VLGLLLAGLAPVPCSGQSTSPIPLPHDLTHAVRARHWYAVHLSRKELVAALSDCDYAKASDPKDSAALSNRGAVWIAANEPARARETSTTQSRCRLKTQSCTLTVALCTAVSVPWIRTYSGCYRRPKSHAAYPQIGPSRWPSCDHSRECAEAIRQEFASRAGRQRSIHTASASPNEDTTRFPRAFWSSQPTNWASSADVGTSPRRPVEKARSRSPCSDADCFGEDLCDLPQVDPAYRAPSAQSSALKSKRLHKRSTFGSR